MVRQGQSVIIGQQIGRVGSTGQSSGPHLHFEQLKDGIGNANKVESYFNGVPSGITSDGSAATGPIYVEGPVSSPVDVVSQNRCPGVSGVRFDGLLRFFARGLDEQLIQYYYSDGAWNWQAITPSAILGSPGAHVDGDTLRVYVMGSDGTPWQYSFVSGSSSWQRTHLPGDPRRHRRHTGCPRRRRHAAGLRQRHRRHPVAVLLCQRLIVVAAHPPTRQDHLIAEARPMKARCVRRSAAAMVITLIATALSTLVSNPARAAGPRPLFQLPFPCHESWNLHTYYGHDDYDIDMTANTDVTEGRPILAAYGGTVASAGWDTNGGWFVRIDHGAGWQTRYLHMIESPMVGEGQSVIIGQQIGRVGSTGQSSGPHLHFEQLEDGIGNANKVESYFNGVPSGITSDGSAATGPIYVEGPVSSPVDV